MAIAIGNMLSVQPSLSAARTAAKLAPVQSITAAKQQAQIVAALPVPVDTSGLGLKYAPISSAKRSAEIQRAMVPAIIAPPPIAVLGRVRPLAPVAAPVSRPTAAARLFGAGTPAPTSSAPSSGGLRGPSGAIPGFTDFEVATPQPSMVPTASAEVVAELVEPTPMYAGGEDASDAPSSAPLTRATFGGAASVTAPDWAWIVGGVAAALGAGWFLHKKGVL